MAEVSIGTLLIDVLVDHGFVTSRGEFRRLIESKSIEQMESKSIVSATDIALKESGTYRIGKKRFIKIVVT